MALKMPVRLTDEQREAFKAAKNVSSFGGYRERKPRSSPNGKSPKAPRYQTAASAVEHPIHDPATVLAKIGHINFDMDEAMRLMDNDEWIGLDIETSGLS